MIRRKTYVKLICDRAYCSGVGDVTGLKGHYGQVLYRSKVNDSGKKYLVVNLFDGFHVQIHGVRGNLREVKNKTIIFNTKLALSNI